LSVTRIIGIVLLVVGVVLLVWGAYNLISFSASAGGKFLNSVAKIGGGQTDVVRNSIIQIVIGIVVSGVGFYIYRKK